MKHLLQEINISRNINDIILNPELIFKYKLTPLHLIKAFYKITKDKKEERYNCCLKGYLREIRDKLDEAINLYYSDKCLPDCTNGLIFIHKTNKMAKINLQQAFIFAAACFKYKGLKSICFFKNGEYNLSSLLPIEKESFISIYGTLPYLINYNMGMYSKFEHTQKNTPIDFIKCQRFTSINCIIVFSHHQLWVENKYFREGFLGWKEVVSSCRLYSYALHRKTFALHHVFCPGEVFCGERIEFNEFAISEKNDNK